MATGRHARTVGADRRWGYTKLDEDSGRESGQGSADPGAPAEVLVESPNGQTKCGGRFVIVEGTVANGKPVWRKQAETGEFEDRWIYYSIKNTWNIGGRKARDNGFSSHSAFIFGESQGRADLPHKVTRTWWIATHDHKFRRDPCIMVKEVFLETVQDEDPQPTAASTACVTVAESESGSGRTDSKRRALMVFMGLCFGALVMITGAVMVVATLAAHHAGGEEPPILSVDECQVALNDPESVLAVFLECKGLQQEEAAAGRSMEIRPRTVVRQALGRRLSPSMLG